MTKVVVSLDIGHLLVIGAWSLLFSCWSLRFGHCCFLQEVSIDYVPFACGYCEGAGASAGADLAQQSSLDEILNALDERGQQLQSFTADVKLIESDPSTGDASTRSGKVLYQAGNSPRIRVTFDKREANRKITEDKVEYLLAARTWL